MLRPQMQYFTMVAFLILLKLKKENLGINFKKLTNYVNKNFKVKKNKLINNKNGNIVKALILVHVFGHPADPEVAKNSVKNIN